MLTVKNRTISGALYTKDPLECTKPQGVLKFRSYPMPGLYDQQLKKPAQLTA